jgi:HSP20 family protein
MINTSPVNEFVSLRQAVDQIFHDSSVGPYRTLWSRTPNGTGNGATVWPLPLDAYATSDEFVIVAAVPGMRPDDLDISFHQGTVVLSGKVANVAESEQGKTSSWYLHELWHGAFRRAVTLPFEVDADKAEATWENGIVRITRRRRRRRSRRRSPSRSARSPRQSPRARPTRNSLARPRADRRHDKWETGRDRDDPGRAFVFSSH